MVDLGDKARDTVTGFTGVVVASGEYLAGCRRLALQPECGDDGKCPDWQWFDEPLLEVVEKNAVAKGPTDTGGPSKFADHGRPTPGR